jgi:crotonobetainyl-CoA:carnitine CoA-transferase CaiB-like acyl-CoA transferase
MAAAFGICAALLGRGESGSGLGSYLDISMTDVMATWTGSARAVSDQVEGTVADADIDASVTPHVPGYGLFATSDGGQLALGVVNEQHFWDALCAALGLTALAGLSFGDRMRRGEELTGAVADAIGSRRRDELVSSLLAVGVPAAPVLDRAGMVARAAFPSFPIRLAGMPGGGGSPAPTLDQHRGQGFRRVTPG